MSSAFRRDWRIAMLVIAVVRRRSRCSVLRTDRSRARASAWVTGAPPSAGRARGQRGRSGADARISPRCWRWSEPSRRNLRISAALDNMTQGLCMFDSDARLILCNERYLDMYGLTRKQAYPGCPLRELLESARRTAHSSRTSTNTWRRPSSASSKARCSTTSSRSAAASSRSQTGRSPEAAGSRRTRTLPNGAAATRNAIGSPRRSSAASAMEAAIAVFRPRVETMLKTVGDHAVAMRTTAATLFAASSKTSQRAEGAVDTSNEASMNVEIAAGAAEELSATIAEISRQLEPDQQHRQHRRGRSRFDQRRRSARWRSRRRRSATWSS